MRNFNERKAEIFRRSDERIKKRKKMLNRALASGISFVLCITVLSIAFFNDIINIKNTAPQISDTVAENENSSESISISYTKVEIQNTGDTENKEITDKVKITQIFSSIQSLYDGNASYSDTKADSHLSADTKDQISDSAKSSASGYTTVIFTTDDGSKAVYTLDGYSLKNNSTNEMITLTDAQLAVFENILGLFELQIRKE